MSAPTQPADRPSEDYYSSYADPGVHRLMLMDRVRTDAYRQAIRQLVDEESIVLDVGSGTGILSLFAAQAGAKEVHAAEASDMIHMAERIADANSLHGPIRFHKGPVEALELDKPVSILVSEWMGYFALAECMFESVLIARDKHLAPGGVMVVPVGGSVVDQILLRIHKLDDGAVVTEHLMNVRFVPLVEE
ncbi:MAG TPA: class I SAM-dependent methyltransferase, partial [Planctomycetota bacterium]|nr:class I SAM-dependent methyltransferase [Planctomycetota bacterium]